MSNSLSHIIKILEENFSNSITNALKILLQSKHLYQSVHVSTEGPPGGITVINESQELVRAQECLEQSISSNWVPAEFAKQYSNIISAPYIVFRTPDVKLFCSKCDGVEAFNSISTEEFLSRHSTVNEIHKQSGGTTIQNFVMSFLCQSCKSIPEVFIIRREGLKISLCGRSPIEFVVVPSVIPKDSKAYFSSAVVAFQSGQVLAANFLLRTLIEQWALVQSKKNNCSADEAIDIYMHGLPEDFKSRFPSIRSMYSDLSIDIHSATGSVTLFEKTKDLITEHFEARRLYKI